MKGLTLGSLFDGIAGFPLSVSHYGIVTKWASEIEAFPIKVSQKHFPDMEHLGDVTKINGAEIEPVDIISFGSPCQDMSVAGKREGLGGARSGLFMEAVRIICEMRVATNGVYPRFSIWENVPGAFSSNNGQDFRAVLEEITEAEIPIPKSGKWAESGMVRGNGRSVAWRVLDAQHWGVPQRRKRIFLVADFAGECAGEILFERESLSRDITKSGEAWKEVATGVGDGVKTASCLTPWDVQSKRIYPEDGKWSALYSGEGGGGAHGYVFREPSRINCQPEGISGTVSSKWAKGTGGPVGDEHYNLICLNDTGGQFMDVSHNVSPTLRAEVHNHPPLILENHPADSRVKIDETGTTQTLTSRMGTGGGNVPMLMQPTYAFSSGNSATARSIGFGEEISPTLKGDSGGNTVPVIAFNGRQDPISGDVTGALDTCSPQAQCVAVGYTNTGFAKYVEGIGTLKECGGDCGGGSETLIAHTVDVRNLNETKELSGTLQSKNTGGYSLNYQNPVRIGYRVRRLTPTECLRLQGFPDNWLDIEGSSDSAKYKAVGNSVAIPCVDFIFSQLAKIMGREG